MSVKGTQTYKRTIGGSVGAGMKSVFNASGRKYFILEHKVSSKYHKAGENQEIIVDEIELGRAPSCQVRFDDSFATVSRRHAAIIKEGEKWKLVNLSHTNPTFLNGTAIENEWYLQNGDEIQLSTNGPKLGFIIPQGARASVGSIGLTRRMSLFRQQALLPYKKALTILSCILLLAVAGGGYMLYKQHIKINHLTEISRKLQEKIDKLRDDDPVTPKKSDTFDRTKTVHVNDYTDNVFFIYTEKIELTLPNGIKNETKEVGLSGTGFMLSDGTFITARHCVEPWAFPGNDTILRYLNLIDNNGGKVVHTFHVVSAKESFVLRSDQFYTDRSNDKEIFFENGFHFSIATLNNKDFAYANVKNHSGGLKANFDKSKNLKAGDELTIYGYPYGEGVSKKGIKPILSKAMVGLDGLSNEGTIVTSESDFDHGNSGGPAFWKNKDGKLEVVGIISAGRGKMLGYIVPISVIK